MPRLGVSAGFAPLNLPADIYEWAGGSGNWQNSSSGWLSKYTNTAITYDNSETPEVHFLDSASNASIGVVGTVVTKKIVSGNSVTLSDQSSGVISQAVSSNEALQVSVGLGCTCSILTPLASSTGITKEGDGTLYLDGASTYTGTTRVLGGNLRPTKSSALGAGSDPIIVSTGATLRLDKVTSGAADIVVSKPMQISGLGFNAAASVRSHLGANTVSGNVTLTSASSVGSASGQSLTISGTVQCAANDLTIVGAGDTTISGVISGTGKVTKIGSGVATLSNVANTYTGATEVTLGELSITGNPATSSVLVGGNNATLRLDVSAPPAISGNVTFDAGSRIRVQGTPVNSAELLAKVTGTISGATPTLVGNNAGWELETTGKRLWLRATGTSKLGVVNKNFDNLTGLSALGGGWYGGLPVGWASDVTNTDYSVIGLGGGVFAGNLQTLSKTTPQFLPLYQDVGTLDASSSVNLLINVAPLAGGTMEIGYALYNATTGALLVNGGTSGISSAQDISFNFGTISAGIPIRLGLWSAQGLGVRNVTITTTPV